MEGSKEESEDMSHGSTTEPLKQQLQQTLLEKMAPANLTSVDNASAHSRATSSSNATAPNTESSTTPVQLLPPSTAVNSGSSNNQGLRRSSIGGNGGGSGSNNNERSAVVLALFGPSVGPCVGDFSTSYNRVNGRLYASTKAILFYSNLFGFERRLCLQLSDVTDIESFRSTSIRVSMVDCEDYTFKRFQDRDHVLSILKELLYREQQQPSSSGGSMPLPVLNNSTSTLSSLSSGPNTTFKFRPGMSRSGLRRGRMMSSDELTDRKNPTTTQPSNVELVSRPHLSSDIDPEYKSPSATTTPRRRSKSVPSIYPLLVPESDPMADSFSALLSPRPAMKRKELPLERSEHSESDIEEEILDQSDVGSVDGDYNGPSLAAIQAVWDRVKEPLDEVHVESVMFPCSLDSYYRLFLADRAPHPVDKYQKEQIGDHEITTTPWKDDDNVAQIPAVMLQTRTFQFLHPLKNSLGPSKAKTTRYQRLQRCGNLGMCWENTTTVEGIPAADCFRVEDRWVLEAVSYDPSEKGGAGLDASSLSSRYAPTQLKLKVTFRIIFFKRTMLRSLIQKNVRQENRNWVKSYVEMVLQALEAQNGKASAAPVTSTDTTPQPQKAVSAMEEQQPTPSAIAAFDTDHHHKNPTVVTSATVAPEQLVASLVKDSPVAIVIILLILTGGCLALLFLVLQLLWMRQTMTLWQTEMELLREQLAAIQTLAQQCNSPSPPPQQ